LGEFPPRPFGKTEMTMSKGQGVWTYQDSVLVLIDYQKEMFSNIRSETSADLIDLNVRLLIKAAKAFNVPVVLSTVGVEMGVNGPTRASILAELPGIEVIDRSSMNAWEDSAFRDAVKKTGRKRLIFGALYTEICLAFPIVDALNEGYDVAFVIDAVGGLSQLAHRTAVERLSHAGAVPNTAFALVTELFRDWKSPVADKAREIIKWYFAELPKMAPEVQKAA
jgi:nicotinamidase-related amidase